MYILKNAYLSIIRNKGRNILIGIIILVISCASAVTLAIKTSASKIINSYEEKNEITGSIEVNRDNVMKNFDPSKENRDSSKKEMIEEFNNLESLSISDIENYANSEYVKNYYYTLSTNLNSTNIEATSISLPSDNQTDDEKNRNNMPMDTNIKDNLGKNEKQGDFSLVGYSSYEAMQEFISGAYSITEGEVSSNFEDATCVINKELATLNNLSVSDKITLVDPNDETKTFEVTITGIFTENEDTNSDNKMNMFSKSSNMIITNANFVKGITESDENLNLKVTPTFILKDKASIEKFEAELTEKGINENLKLTTNLEEVESATKSISNISTFSTTFLVITLIIGATILFVLNMINVRERKYEIGVLRTIGMKKSSLTLQFMTELLIITLIFLILGTILGSVISVPTANMLLKNEIESSSNESQNINKNFGGNMMHQNGDMKAMPGMNNSQNIQKIENINAVVDFSVVVKLIGIGILLTIISSIASMICIQRFSPLTILKERS